MIIIEIYYDWDYSNTKRKSIIQSEVISLKKKIMKEIFI